MTSGEHCPINDVGRIRPDVEITIGYLGLPQACRDCIDAGERSAHTRNAIEYIDCDATPDKGSHKGAFNEKLPTVTFIDDIDRTAVNDYSYWPRGASEPVVYRRAFYMAECLLTAEN